MSGLGWIGVRLLKDHTAFREPLEATIQHWAMGGTNKRRLLRAAEKDGAIAWLRAHHTCALCRRHHERGG